MVRYTKYIDSYNIYFTNYPLKFHLHRCYEYLFISGFYANLQPGKLQTMYRQFTMHNLITALLLLKDKKYTTQNFSTTKELHLLET